MLVLTRKEGDEIIIDKDIRIRVLRIRGGQIRVGIDAPRDVRIVRSEIASVPATQPASDVPPPALAKVTGVTPAPLQAAATAHGITCR